jgi:hypothetical protein
MFDYQRPLDNDAVLAANRILCSVPVHLLGLVT